MNTNKRIQTLLASETKTLANIHELGYVMRANHDELREDARE